MCRHLAWLGEQRSIARVVLDGEHSLLEQSWAPREQRRGRLNADGFGVGWYTGVRPEPARYRRVQPIWTDASFASVAGVVSSHCVLAAVRSATIGMPIEETAAAPFTAGTVLFSHNGALDGYLAAAPRLRELLPAGAAAGVESRVDSALLWALLRHRLDSGQPLPAALAGVVTEVTAVTTGRLNLLATDGRRVVATRYGETLYLCEQADGVLVASEPTGADQHWQRVPENCLLVVDDGGVKVTPLDAPEPTPPPPGIVAPSRHVRPESAP
jgi:glutamine amidotransferase